MLESVRVMESVGVLESVKFCCRLLTSIEDNDGTIGKEINRSITLPYCNRAVSRAYPEKVLKSILAMNTAIINF